MSCLTKLDVPIAATTVRRRMAAIFSIMLFATIAVAAGPRSRLTFKNLSTGDGLSSDTVYAIAQDATGFVWIATGDGLNRYDGHRWSQPKYELFASHSG